MRFWVSLFVSLKIPDAEAATAANTLRRLGYGEALKSLEKEEVWSVLVEANNEKEAHKMGAEFARRELVNDNKEGCRIEVGERELDFGKCDVPRVLVRLKIEDGAAITVMSILQKRLGFGDRVLEVKHGTAWMIGAPQEHAERMAKELLVNKNKDEYFIL